MDTSINSDADLAAIRGDLAALKGDVGSLIEHLKSGAKNGVQNAADQISGGVQGFSQSAADSGQRSATAIGAWVEKQPLLALLVAFGVGYVGARALSR
jgi:hypothetical protein